MKHSRLEICICQTSPITPELPVTHLGRLATLPGSGGASWVEWRAGGEEEKKSKKKKKKKKTKKTEWSCQQRSLGGLKRHRLSPISPTLISPECGYFSRSGAERRVNDTGCRQADLFFPFLCFTQDEPQTCHCFSQFRSAMMQVIKTGFRTTTDVESWMNLWWLFSCDGIIYEAASPQEAFMHYVDLVTVAPH